MQTFCSKIQSIFCFDTIFLSQFLFNILILTRRFNSFHFWQITLFVERPQFGRIWDEKSPKTFSIFFSRKNSSFFTLTLGTPYFVMYDFRFLNLQIRGSHYAFTISRRNFGFQIQKILYNIRGKYPSFCYVCLILQDFRLLKLKNKRYPTVSSSDLNMAFSERLVCCPLS